MFPADCRRRSFGSAIANGLLGRASFGIWRGGRSFNILTRALTAFEVGYYSNTNVVNEQSTRACALASVAQFCRQCSAMTVVLEQHMTSSQKFSLCTGVHPTVDKLSTVHLIQDGRGINVTSYL